MARAGRGLFVLGKPDILFQCWLEENLFLSYRFTNTEKDLKDNLAAAAAGIIECLLGPGSLIISIGINPHFTGPDSIYQ